VQEGPDLAGRRYISALISPTSWMLMEIPVVTNTTFLTINQTVKMEAISAVETLEINGPVARHSNSEVLTYKINTVEFPDVAKSFAPLTFGVSDCTAFWTSVVVEQYPLAECLYVISNCCV
jgi:hypothetical protein